MREWRGLRHDRMTLLKGGEQSGQKRHLLCYFEVSRVVVSTSSAERQLKQASFEGSLLKRPRLTAAACNQQSRTMSKSQLEDPIRDQQGSL